MTVLTEYFELGNGNPIPKLGFGTWQTPNAVAPEAVTTALRLGYRHIDTAHAYGNEAGVAQGLKASGLVRDQVFITTKVRAEFKSYDQAVQSIAESLAALDTAYVDLLLIHAPKPWAEMGGRSDAMYFDQNVAVWQALEEAYQRGDARALGVSNFQVADLENITSRCEIAPAANQIEVNIGYPEADLVAYCQQRGILVEAYSPIATGGLLDHAGIKAVADKYGKSVAQVCLRWVLQKDCLPLPKSVHEAYIRQNTEVDFEISADDMATLDGLSAE